MIYWESERLRDILVPVDLYLYVNPSMHHHQETPPLIWRRLCNQLRGLILAAYSHTFASSLVGAEPLFVGLKGGESHGHLRGDSHHHGAQPLV